MFAGAARILSLALLTACVAPLRAPEVDARAIGGRTVGFLLLDGVFNSELTAPYDVFQHTIFHTRPGMHVVTIGRSLDPVVTFEGLVVQPTHTLESAPELDVIVVPSGEHSMGKDLQDRRVIDWLRDRAPRADHLLSVCDGAFLLAGAGLLDGRRCTTFPGDIPAFSARFPHLDVIEDATFVADGSVITGAGGAASFDPALFLVETLYGKQTAEGIARGLVIDWRSDRCGYVVGDPAANPGGNRPPTCYLPGDTVDASVAFETAAGQRTTLAAVLRESAGAKVAVLVLLGGAAASREHGRAGMWCEDTFNDLSLLRRLIPDFAPRGVVFVPVCCPPVDHAAEFGFAEHAFTRPGDDPIYRTARTRFVTATQDLRTRDLLPFEPRFYDPRMHLLRTRSGAPESLESGTWNGRFKWYRDPQSYGTPTWWILDAATREVLGTPFFQNNYEARGGRLRYAERDVRARLERALLDR